MIDENYIVATIRPWNIKVFNEVISKYPGRWHLITQPEELTVELVERLNPKFIFFSHWSYIVPEDILNSVECVCFHEADLPCGRGGSPIQNHIVRGNKETMISALRMIKELDAGPVYLKRPLSLEGLGEEIFIRASKIVAEMILEIITKEPVPKEQEGKVTLFPRRKPEQSEVNKELKNLEELFDHIRMLDASEYPRAFLRYGCFKFEISRPALRTNSIEANIHITKGNNGEKE